MKLKKSYVYVYVSVFLAETPKSRFPRTTRGGAPHASRIASRCRSMNATLMIAIQNAFGTKGEHWSLT